eukprot:TRINITY_DN2131_c2_g1_i1.p2 TRINITY_DN2131_c2_g1~~TRINITY_DN2131_c2_g1_i1.p2  ORF type:complete len:293 (+),score=44.76 TRINITY_DN2131_c2_g1_i1:1420-2298(+)
MAHWTISLHIGVGSYPGHLEADDLKTLMKAACKKGELMLENNGELLDAAEAVMTTLEDSGKTNAGAGGNRNEEGKAEGDATAVTSEGLLGCVVRCSAKNPSAEAIRLAKQRNNTGEKTLAPVMLSKGGCSHTSSSPHSPNDKEDTIGVIITREHQSVVTVSSGGYKGKPVGRIGEAGHPGAGCWATPTSAAALSGRGEDAMSSLLAARLTFSPSTAEATIVDFCRTKKTPCGGIFARRDDASLVWSFFAFYNTQAFGTAVQHGPGKPVEPRLFTRTGLAKGEWCSIPEICVL